MRRLIVLAALALGSAAAPTRAAIVTQTYEFRAVNFEGPANTVSGGTFSGTFTVTYDDAVDSRDLAVDSFSSNLTFGTPALLTYLAAEDRLILGANGVAAASSAGTDDFTLVLYADSTGLVPFPGGYLTPRALVGRLNVAGLAFSEDIVFGTPGSLPPLQANAVPEPSTWAMMLLGFGAIGAAMRRRQRELAAAA